MVQTINNMVFIATILISEVSQLEFNAQEKLKRSLTKKVAAKMDEAMIYKASMFANIYAEMTAVMYGHDTRCDRE
jgi:hypothetical protein